MFKYTPRQVEGMSFLAERRERFETARALSIGAAASRGDPKDVKRQIKELTK